MISKKIFMILALLTAFVGGVSAQNVQYQLSSHILDIQSGKPAVGVKIALYKATTDGTTFTLVEEKITDENGRIKDFLPLTKDYDNRGTYKLRYYTQPYFSKQGQESFYPYIEVVFQISDKTAHYHVPITLSAFGYSTYRGN